MPKPTPFHKLNRDPDHQRRAVEHVNRLMRLRDAADPMRLRFNQTLAQAIERSGGKIIQWYPEMPGPLWYQAKARLASIEVLIEREQLPKFALERRQAEIHARRIRAAEENGWPLLVVQESSLNLMWRQIEQWKLSTGRKSHAKQA